MATDEHGTNVKITEAYHQLKYMPPRNETPKLFKNTDIGRWGTIASVNYTIASKHQMSR